MPVEVAGPIQNESQLEQRPLRQLKVKDIIRHFTPSWFSVTMGTGILGILLYSLPYKFDGLEFIGGTIFAINTTIYVLFSIVTLARYTIFPEVFKLMLSHPQQSMFIGTIPMGLATIVNSLVIMIPMSKYPWVPYVAWGLWWLDVALTLGSVLITPFSMILLHEHSLDQMTAAWLLPVVPAIVCAASGGLVSLSLDPDKAAVTILLSYVLWGIGVGLAAIVLVIYFQRLVLHSLPPAGVIVSAFLPLGPLGQGSYGIMKLGEASREVFPLVFPHQPLLGESFYGAGIFVGFIMWGFALWWAVLAISSVLNYMLIKRTMPFNIGWWGFTFPIGVYTSATLTLATYLDSTFLRILGTVYTVSLLLLWVMVMLLTLSHTWSGRLLYAPCLNSTFRTAKSQ